MNREQAKDLLPLITAFVEGKEVQVQSLQGEWCDSPSPAWGFPAYRYRIKPEPVKVTAWAVIESNTGCVKDLFQNECAAKYAADKWVPRSGPHNVVKLEGFYER